MGLVEWSPVSCLRAIPQSDLITAWSARFVSKRSRSHKAGRRSRVACSCLSRLDGPSPLCDDGIRSRPIPPLQPCSLGARRLGKLCYQRFRHVFLTLVRPQHKSQGLTLDRAEMSLAKVFEAGQMYVALSRVRSLEGLSLRNIDWSKLKAHPKVIEWHRQQQQQQEQRRRQQLQL